MYYVQSVNTSKPKPNKRVNVSVIIITFFNWLQLFSQFWKEDIIFRLWCWCFIKWESKNSKEVEYGPKTAASCDLTSFDSDYRKHQHLFILSNVLFFWISKIHYNDDWGCLYYTTSLSRNKVEWSWWIYLLWTHL